MATAATPYAQRRAPTENVRSALLYPTSVAARRTSAHHAPMLPQIIDASERIPGSTRRGERRRGPVPLAVVRPCTAARRARPVLARPAGCRVDHRLVGARAPVLIDPERHRRTMRVFPASRVPTSWPQLPSDPYAHAREGVAAKLLAGDRPGGTGRAGKHARNGAGRRPPPDRSGLRSAIGAQAQHSLSGATPRWAPSAIAACAPPATRPRSHREASALPCPSA